jgi:hypothetical protein
MRRLTVVFPPTGLRARLRPAAGLALLCALLLLCPAVGPATAAEGEPGSADRNSENYVPHTEAYSGATDNNTVLNEHPPEELVERPGNVPADAPLPAPWPAGMQLRPFDGSVWNFTVNLPPGELEPIEDAGVAAQYPLVWHRGNTVGPVISDIVLTVYESGANILFGFDSLVIEEVEKLMEVYPEIVEGPLYVEAPRQPKYWMLNRLRDPEDGEEVLKLTACYHNMYYSFGFVYPQGADTTYMWAQVRSVLDSFRIVDPEWYADTHSVAEHAAAAGVPRQAPPEPDPQFELVPTLTTELVRGAPGGTLPPAWPAGTPLREVRDADKGFSLSLPDAGEFLTEEEAGVPPNDLMRYPVIWQRGDSELYVFDRMLMGYIDNETPLTPDEFAAHVAEELGNVSVAYPEVVAGPQQIELGGAQWTRVHLRRPQNAADVLKLFRNNGRHYYSFYLAFDQDADLALVEAQARAIVGGLEIVGE